jgi:hypothetical protein
MMAAGYLRSDTGPRSLVFFLLAVCLALAWPGAPQAGIFDLPGTKPAAQGTLFDAEIPPGEYIAFL